MRRLMLAIVVTIATIGTTAPASAEWWRVPTGSETTAKIRTVFAHRLDTHRREVEQIRRDRRAARLAALEAAAVPQAAPATPTTYSTTASGGYLSDAEIASYARAAGFPEPTIPTMLAIAHRESRGCPTAVNGLTGCPSYATAAALLASSEYHACGLFQAYPCYGGAAWLSPSTNAAVAYDKYAARGLSPWSL